MESKHETQQERHPLFPSGDWEGFYTYALGPEAPQHKMYCALQFKDQVVTGGGGDDVGFFFWQGSYDLQELVCVMTKFYSTHRVFYSGQVDENGIWGTWQLYGDSGGFHIWPKSSEQNYYQQEHAWQEVPEVKTEPLKLPDQKEKDNPQE